MLLYSPFFLRTSSPSVTWEKDSSPVAADNLESEGAFNEVTISTTKAVKIAAVATSNEGVYTCKNSLSTTEVQTLSLHVYSKYLGNLLLLFYCFNAYCLNISK